MKLFIRVLLISATIFALYFVWCVNKKIERVDEIFSSVELNPSSYRILNSDNDTALTVIDKSITSFMRREGLCGGASIAISKNGKLVYAKGLGFSDLTDSIVMQPYNLMRVASVSKLITAVAVMKLVEENRIGLHQKVFGPVGVLNSDEYMAYKDDRMSNVTVYQLLNHSGGWTSRWGDPMFMPHSIARQTGKDLPISIEDIIRFMQKKSMHFTPGSASVYSNFGYGILGEVVAKASGMPYEQYVKKRILAPLGIFDMQIGFSHKENRLPNEVIYYEADTSYCAFDFTDNTTLVRRAYGGTDIQTLGSAGGWIASATDLLKLMLTIDGFDDVPDQLTKASIDTMTCRNNFFDPLGWRKTVGDSWYRSGTLAATSAIMVRHSNNICYVVLLNCSNHKGPEIASSLATTIDKAIAKIETFPEKDLLQNDDSWNCYNRLHVAQGGDK